MSDIDKGQVSTSAAEVYEAFFLPALFQRWAQPVAETAEVAPGDHVLDVACGTGVLARVALSSVGPSGAVIGLDVNPGMLAVAATRAPGIDWREGRAEHLPFSDGSFDAVVSQFGLMFFDDRVAALREMGRVLKPGGRLAVAVWDTLENTPGYAAMTDLLRRLFGDEAARSLEAPYALGDVGGLRQLLSAAGLPGAEIRTHAGTAQFASIEDWVYTDIRGWTLADQIDDDRYALLLGEAMTELAGFVTDGDTVEFAAPAHIALWRKGA